jgi:hypothetical protein
MKTASKAQPREQLLPEPLILRSGSKANRELTEPKLLFTNIGRVNPNILASTKVKSRKQAIAIGLSEARKKGAKVPSKS